MRSVEKRSTSTAAAPHHIWCWPGCQQCTRCSGCCGLHLYTLTSVRQTLSRLRRTHPSRICLGNGRILPRWEVIDDTNVAILPLFLYRGRKRGSTSTSTFRSTRHRTITTIIISYIPAGTEDLLPPPPPPSELLLILSPPSRSSSSLPSAASTTRRWHCALCGPIKCRGTIYGTLLEPSQV